MLRALYEYGKSHPEVLKLPGFSDRTIKYVVELDGTGGFVSIRPSERRSVSCPDMGGATRGSGVVANVLMEKASISIGLDPGVSGKALERVEGKRACFLDYFRELAIPEFAVVLRALETDDILDAIQSEAVACGVSAGDVVGFAVSGALLSDVPAVQSWWASRASGGSGPCTSVDVVTGEACAPARLFDPVPSSVKIARGGQASGVALISFNKPSFESYNLTQGFNSPMSAGTAKTVMDAFIDLGNQAVSLGDVNFMHWYDCDVDSADDVLLQAFFAFDGQDDGPDGSDADEASAVAAASTLVTSPLTGTSPVSLMGRQYHIMVVQPEMSRMVVRSYEKGSYEDLYRNIQAWFDDMSLVSAFGKGWVRPRKLNALLFALLSASESKKKSYSDKMKHLSPLVVPILKACIDGTCLPDAVAARALAAIHSGIYNSENAGYINPVAMQCLKLWLIRKNNERSRGIMAELNRGCAQPAYHCGRLLAVYEQVQAQVNPDVNVGVLTKFYAGCSQSPALVLGNMQALSVHHFQKFTSRSYRRLYESVLEEVWSDLGADIPKNLTLEEKAYFALGYWQQRADLSARVRALREELKARRTENQDKQEG